MEKNKFMAHHSDAWIIGVSVVKTAFKFLLTTT